MASENHAIIMDWVGREILPHESVVRAWLRRSLGADDLEDVIQQSYAQIASLSDISHIRCGRAYFFATARNVALMRLRRARIVRIETMAELGQYEMVEDGPSPERVAAGRRELERVRRLIDALPARCGQIMRMRKIEGLSQKVVARKLGVTENIVENDIAKGLRLILQAMAEGEHVAEQRLTNLQRFEHARSRQQD